MDTIDTAETEPVRVRSRSLVKSHKKISSTVSSPVAVPRSVRLFSGSQPGPLQTFNVYGGRCPVSRIVTRGSRFF